MLLAATVGFFVWMVLKASCGGASVSLTRTIEDALSCEHIRPREKCSNAMKWKYSVTPEDSAAISALLNMSILIIGDSIAGQLSRALDCYLKPESGIKVSYSEFFVFPIQSNEMVTVLDNIFSKDRYDAVVIATGTWYNWKTEELSERFINSISKDSASNILRKICKRGLNDTLKKAYASGRTSYEIAELFRVSCPQLLGSVGYVSGLMRLAEVVKIHHRRWPAVYWKDVPPQHFPNSASGRYSGVVGLQCAAVKNFSEAFARNFYSEHIFLNNPHISIIKTWGNDITMWDRHLPRDCTHFCVPSDVTWHWAAATIKCVAAANC